MATPPVAYRPARKATDARELVEELPSEARERHRAGVHRATVRTATISSSRASGRELRDLRLTGPAATRASGPLARRARGDRPSQRRPPPLVLLDDVMSELDRDRRRALVDLAALHRRPGRDHGHRSRARARRERRRRDPGRGVRRPLIGDGGGMTTYRRAPRPVSLVARSHPRRARARQPAGRGAAGVARRCRPGDRGRSVADGRARRGRDRVLLGVGVGAGARPDGAGRSSSGSTPCSGRAGCRGCAAWRSRCVTESERGRRRDAQIPPPACRSAPAGSVSPRRPH